MIDHSERIKGIVKGQLKKTAFGDDTVGSAIGYGYGVIPVEGGKTYLGPYWNILITMRNPMLGEGDLTEGGAITHALPPVTVIETFVSQSVENLRNRKSKILRGEPDTS